MGIDLTEIVVTMIGLVMSAVIVPLVRAAFVWLKGKTQNEALVSAIAEAEKVAEGVVAGLQATVVAGLKQKSTDGKLSADDAKEVAGMAVGMFLSDLSSRSLQVLEHNADDLSAFIRNMIEAKLAVLKSQEV